MALVVEKRGLTSGERMLLEERSRRYPIELSVVGIFLMLGGLLAGLFAMCDQEFGLGIGAVRAAGTACFLSLLASIAVVRFAREPNRDRIHPDLAEGFVTVFRVTPVAAVRDDTAFFIDSGDGSVLYLEGAYLDGPVKDGRFPCTSFELVRATHAEESLSITCQGEPIVAPDLNLSEEIDDAAHMRLSDGIAIRGSVATLATDLATWLEGLARIPSPPKPDTMVAMDPLSGLRPSALLERAPLASRPQSPQDETKEGPDKSPTGQPRDPPNT